MLHSSVAADADAVCCSCPLARSQELDASLSEYEHTKYVAEQIENAIEARMFSVGWSVGMVCDIVGCSADGSLTSMGP